MAQFEKHFVQDLTQDIKVRQCDTIVFNADNLSNVVSVALYNGEEAYTGGGTVVGAVVCPDGATVALDGTLSGNVASITLTGDCFALQGQIGVSIQIVSGDVRTTVLKAIYNVDISSTDTIVDPGSRITLSLAEIEAKLDEIPTILANAQTAIDGIEAQKDTMIASIASVAGQGTDTTLTQSGVAADAKATGDQVRDLKSAINVLYTQDISIIPNSAWDDSTTTPYVVDVSGYTRCADVIPYNAQGELEIVKTGSALPYFIYYDKNLNKQGTTRYYTSIPATAKYFVFYAGSNSPITSATYTLFAPYKVYEQNIADINSEIIESKKNLRTDAITLIPNSAWDDSTISPTIVSAANYKRCANPIVYSADAEFTNDASGTINYIYYDANNEKLGTATNYLQIPNTAHTFVFYAAPSITITKANYQYFVRKSQQVYNYLSNVAVGNDNVPVTNKTAQIPVASSQHGGYMSAADKIKLDTIVSPGSMTINGSGVSKNAAAFGFLPTNDGVSNATAMQNALSGGGTILVDLVGAYKLSRTIRVPSNCTIIFGAGTYVERCTTDGKYPLYLFINDGVFSGDYNENITIKNLTVVNGAISGDPDIVYPIVGLRGIVTMARINNFTIDGFTLVDHTFNNYALQATFFNNATFRNIHIETLKDGIHLGIGNGFTIKGCQFLTNDDCIALNCVDYPASNFGVGDIQNGVIEDITLLESLSESFTKKRGIFILSGAWEDWESGNEYQLYGDYCVNDGRLYQSYAANPTLNTQVSTVPPTHESGSQTYSDGFTWLMKQSVNVGYSAVIKNVVFRNIMYERDVVNFFEFSSENSAYLRAVYPTAQVVPNENITFENVRKKRGNSTFAFLDASYPFDKLKICMSECIALNRLINFNSDTYVPMTNRTNISLVGNYYDYTGKTLIAEDPNNVPDVYVSICGSMKANGFVYSAYNLTPHALANDLV